MQLLAHCCGGRVEGGHHREYGPALLPVTGKPLFHSSKPVVQADESRDRVTEVPPGYSVTASTDLLPIAAMENAELRRYGVQFHPEVNHTVFGRELLENFLFRIAGLEATGT